MKIIFAAPRYHTNQIPIVEGLQKEGNEVIFWAQYVGVIEDHDILTPVMMHKSLITKITSFIRKKTLKGSDLESSNMKKFIPSFIWIIKEFLSEKPDVVITRERGRVSRVISLCCKMCGIKGVILYVQEPYLSKIRDKSLREKIKSNILPRIKYTPVKYMSAEENREVADEHMYYVPLVYPVRDKKDTIHEKYLEDGVLNILDIGKYRDYKYHFGALEAIRKLPKDAKIKLTIIGQCKTKDEEDYMNSLKQKAIEYGIEDKIELLRDVPYDEMKDIYSKYDLLLLTSKSESAGMVILEAMANGMGVVCTKTCGLAFLIEEANAGYTYRYDDADSLADIIERLEGDEEKVRRLAQNAYDYASQNNNFKSYKDALMNLLSNERIRIVT